jgi:hypothetical protein
MICRTHVPSFGLRPEEHQIPVSLFLSATFRLNRDEALTDVERVARVQPLSLDPGKIGDSVEEACRKRVSARLVDDAFDAVFCSWQFGIGETLAMRYSDPAFMRFEWGSSAGVSKQ